MKTTAIIAAALGALSLLVSVYFYLVGVNLAIITAERGGLVTFDIRAWPLLTSAGFAILLFCIAAYCYYVSRRRQAELPHA